MNHYTQELRAIDAEIDGIYDHFQDYQSSDLHRLYALRFWEQKRIEAAQALVLLSESPIQCKAPSISQTPTAFMNSGQQPQLTYQ